MSIKHILTEGFGNGDFNGSISLALVHGYGDYSEFELFAWEEQCIFISPAWSEQAKDASIWSVQANDNSVWSTITADPIPVERC